MHALTCTINYKNNITKRSVRSFCHYVVRRVIMDFEQNFPKKTYFNLIYKITRPTSQFLPSAKTYNASCRVFDWTPVMRTRSQNHFHSYFTSKTPYSFDTRGILSTPSRDNHGRLKMTTNKVIRKRSWQTIKEDNSTKHLKGQQFLFTKMCIDSEVSLKILSHE